MRKLLLLLTLMLAYGSMSAQQTFDIDLWPKGLPNSNGIDKSQPFDDSKQNFKPSIRVFLPEASNANGMAIVALPGGGYSHLATGHEGYDWAEYFNSRGFAYVVLKYRMPHGHTEVPISDAKEALRLVRENAAKWNINPTKVGIMGSSAGGHLASTVATHSDSITAPNFQILFYPVITFKKELTHWGSRANLITSEASQEMVDLYSNELQVTPNTPPAVILLSDDDRTVPSYNGVSYYMALNKAGVKASLFVYPSGGHGWGNRQNFKYHNEMEADLSAWLKTLK